MSKFVDCGRDQAFRPPSDLRDWSPEDDLAYFVTEAVERVEMNAFKVNHRGTDAARRCLEAQAMARAEAERAACEAKAAT